MANSKAVEAAYKIDYPGYATQGVALDVFREEHPDEYKEMVGFTVPIIESAMEDLLDAVGDVVEYTERSDFASHEDCQENARDIEGWLTALRRLAEEYKKAKGE